MRKLLNTGYIYRRLQEWGQALLNSLTLRQPAMVRIRVEEPEERYRRRGQRR